MITAEEIRLKYIPNGCVNLKLIGGGDGKPQFKHEKKVIDEMLVEFAKLHVEAALKEASKNVKIEHRDYKNNKFIPYGQEVSSDMENCYWGVNNESILNAYPLTSIK